MKKDLGITTVHANKPRTFQEYVQYRNTILIRAQARTEKFKDYGNNYYWYRLKEIDMQYPEFKGLGQVKLKENK